MVENKNFQFKLREGEKLKLVLIFDDHSSLFFALFT